MTAVPIAERKAGDETVGADARRQVIVVGVDGSAPSWDAFAWAAGEARRVNGRVIAVYVTALIQPEEALGFTAPLGFGAAADARDQVAEELRGEVSKRADELDVDVTFVRGSGDAVHVLIEVARAEHADLMAVGRSAKV